MAAHALGLSEELAQELMGSSIYRAMKEGIPTMPRRSRRWFGEMEEIAATFESLGLTPSMFLGAAEMYRLVGKTPLGDPTSRGLGPTFDATIEAVVEELGRE